MLLLRAFFLRAGILYAAWWVMTEGDASGLAPGAAIVILVSLLSCRLYPPSLHVIHPLGALVFAGYFILRSVAAGVDVGRRLLSPSVPVNPGYITIRTSLPAGSPRWLLANALSLMPGTLSVRLMGTSLELHCLDLDLPVKEDVRLAERKVAGVFGLNNEEAGEATP
ncbi:MAG: Na+/H+ antiporter subunit E [Marinobacter sp.]|uniref:Na+/H+ antiporter subunit E n=1 Tax=Marinobacter sp. TaxID=50741 RepID=UPI003564EABB